MTRHEFAAAMDAEAFERAANARIDEARRAELRAWLDRRVLVRTSCDVDCVQCGRAPSWRDWFDGDEYLGVRSARTGPDAVASAQRCGCSQCAGGEP